MSHRANWLVRFSVSVVAAALLITATVVGAAPYAWRALNSHDEVPVRLPGLGGISARSVILDKDGQQIGVFEAENIQPVNIAALPEHVVGAFLAVEDSDFYGHRGVNLRSLVRAAFANFQFTGSRQGASTITQQVVKLEFLGGLPRDGRYKILQARYAAMLEKSLTKAQIVERYLSRVFLGNNAYGIESAAEVYFQKSAAQLTVAEAGFLAGLVRAPSTYDPIRRPQQARRRFAQVVERLVETNLVTADEGGALVEPDSPTRFVIPEALSEAPERPTSRTHISEMVREFLLEQSTVLGDTYAERYNALYRGGITVTTTIDRDAQKAAEDAAKKMPETSLGIDSALVSLDSATGAIRALRGGAPFRPGRNEVNLGLRRRQTGSSIKMFVLVSALEAGVQATDLIDGTLPCTMPNPEQPDEPFRITRGVSKPTTSLAEQTWLSINCAYARLAQIVGLNRVVNGIYRYASSQWLRPETFPILPYASLSTGANEMSPLDMASGAQTIANGGVHHEPWFVQEVKTTDGTVLYRHDVAGDVVTITAKGQVTSKIAERVISKEVADKAVDILKQTLIRGTARRTPLANERPSAGKTGTQDRNTNAWFVGFTPWLTTSVWVGDPKGYTSMDRIPEFVRDGVPRVQGATYPARIWKAYMDAAHDALAADYEGRPVDWTAPPPPLRNPVRLYLPGLDCTADVVSGRLPRSLTGTYATVVPTVPSTTVAPSTTAPATTTTTAAPGAVPVPTVAPTVAPTTTQPRGPVVRIVDPGTTIPRTVTDPTLPVTGVDPARTLIYDCAKGVPKSVRTTP
ncbi:MAG: transglycosylase domain-containing protein [Ilumatobacteraceae bacterium]